MCRIGDDFEKEPCNTQERFQDFFHRRALLIVALHLLNLLLSILAREILSRNLEIVVGLPLFQRVDTLGKVLFR